MIDCGRDSLTRCRSETNRKDAFEREFFHFGIWDWSNSNSGAGSNSGCVIIKGVEGGISESIIKSKRTAVEEGSAYWAHPHKQILVHGCPGLCLKGFLWHVSHLFQIDIGFAY